MVSQNHQDDIAFTAKSKENQMLKRVKCLVLACCLVLAGLPCFSVEAVAQSQQPQSISVAIGQSYPPFFFVDKQEKPAGWLVDLWRLWSKKTGVDVRFVPASFGETLYLVGEGKVDAHGGCFYSKKRALFLDYTAPLVNASTSIFFHRNIYGIKGIADLRGYQVGVIKGDYAEDYLRSKVPGVDLAVYANNQALFRALERGALKVFVSDTPIALYYLKDYGLANAFKHLPGRPIYTNDYIAAVTKGNAALAQLVKQGFAKISDQERHAIAKRWSVATALAGKDVLTIAADRDFPPFTWLTPSGRPAGILIDLWRLWSTKTGKRIAFVFGDWDDTLRYLKTGKAKVHSGLFRTPPAIQEDGLFPALVPGRGKLVLPGWGLQA